MTGEKRDCVCPRSKHEHGTVQAYNRDGCRCERCTSARAPYIKRWRHIDAYRRAAGHPGGLVEAIGTARRLQALSVVGWSTPQLARKLGVAQQRVSELRVHRGKVQAALAVRIAKLYDELWDVYPTGVGATRARRDATARGWVPPMGWDDDTIDDPTVKPMHKATREYDSRLKPCGTRAAYLRHQSRGEDCAACEEGYRVWNRDRMRARRAPDPLDEVAIEEAMRGRRVTLTDGERHEAIARLTAAGKSGPVIAALLHTTGRTVTRRRTAEGRAA